LACSSGYLKDCLRDRNFYKKGAYLAPFFYADKSSFIAYLAMLVNAYNLALSLLHVILMGFISMVILSRFIRRKSHYLEHFMINRTVLNTTAAAILSASAMLSFTANADENEIAERVKPVGHLVILSESDTAKTADAAVTEAAAPAAAHPGKATYDTACFACHRTGAAGAPILGNKEAWAARLSQSFDTLYSHAIDGFKAMPAKGGAAQLSDDEVKAVVDYMVEQSS
jgi:cytochrome c5